MHQRRWLEGLAAGFFGKLCAGKFSKVFVDKRQQLLRSG